MDKVFSGLFSPFVVYLKAGGKQGTDSGHVKLHPQVPAKLPAGAVIEFYSGPDTMTLLGRGYTKNAKDYLTTATSSRKSLRALFLKSLEQGKQIYIRFLPLDEGVLSEHGISLKGVVDALDRFQPVPEESVEKPEDIAHEIEELKRQMMEITLRLPRSEPN